MQQFDSKEKNMTAVCAYLQVNRYLHAWRYRQRVTAGIVKPQRFTPDPPIMRINTLKGLFVRRCVINQRRYKLAQKSKMSSWRHMWISLLGCDYSQPRQSSSHLFTIQTVSAKTQQLTAYTITLPRNMSLLSHIQHRKDNCAIIYVTLLYFLLS